MASNVPAVEEVADPVVEEYKRHLDLASLRENLKRTPHERVTAMLSMLRLVEEARRAGEKAGLRR